MSQDQEQNIDAQGEANGMPISYSYETLPVTLESEMKRSYLDYAMSVIVGRALPDVRDGFKPVHRRVLFSMHELGNDFSHPTKKCARVVGDVIGKYHPHGDQAAYQTLVRLAQDFSMRYPLVDSQGNFGSIDGDGAAAMRYTECRLAKIADAMLDDLDQDTVDFIPNFDNIFLTHNILFYIKIKSSLKINGKVLSFLTVFHQNQHNSVLAFLLLFLHYQVSTFQSAL